MKILIALLMVVACGKDRVVTRNGEIQYLTAPSPTYCSGKTKQECAVQCIDDHDYAIFRCSKIVTPTQKNQCERDAVLRQNECIDMTNSLPADVIIP